VVGVCGVCVCGVCGWVIIVTMHGTIDTKFT